MNFSALYSIVKIVTEIDTDLSFIHWENAMEKIKKLWRMFFSLDIPMRLCIFNMITFIGVIGAAVSLIITLVMRIQIGQVIPIAVAVAIMVLSQILANKFNKLDIAAILAVSVVGFVVFPIMFVEGGGIHSGMPLWFLLAVVFDAILISGKAKYIIFGLQMLMYGALIYFEYRFPEMIKYLDTEVAFAIDMAQSLAFAGVCIFLTVSFQLLMYRLTLKREELAAKDAQRARVEAEAANAAKSSFLANISHEIRTPMGVIIGMNEMIQREANQSSIIEYSKDVNASAKTLLSIINDILDLTKIESGKMNIIEVDYPLDGLIREISELSKVKQEETGIVFEMKICPGLPKVVHGDELRLKECLINIIGNAFKYTEKGKITFELSGEKQGDQELLTFSVTDTGHGIREEDMEKLLESFVRLDENRNRNIQGTGLGLSITSNLLELMGSKLEIQSKEQVGSRFFFTIQQRIVDDTIMNGNVTETKKVVKETNKPGFVAPDKHILVVDDNAINLKVFCALLKRTQVQIDAVTGGREALEKTREKHYDMIFMDHMMPEMDGEETFLKMREEGILGDTPIVMLTANAIVGVREHFLDLGFTDFLTKPIEFKRLEETLQTYLQ